MCLIINKKPSDSIGEYFFKNVWERNKDGYGILFRDDQNNVQAIKGLTYKGFLKDYAEHGLESRECLIHFRMATHGAIDDRNCHPFQITGNLWFMHNGIIDAPEYADKTVSDSYRLNVLVLQKIFREIPIESHEDFLRSESFTFLLAALAGHSNRLAFMDKKGIHIVPDIGDWEVTSKGLVVSNDYAYSVDLPESVWENFSKKYSKYDKYGFDSAGYERDNWPDYDSHKADKNGNSITGSRYALDMPKMYAEDYTDDLKSAIYDCENFPEAMGELVHDLAKERETYWYGNNVKKKEKV